MKHFYLSAPRTGRHRRFSTSLRLLCLLLGLLPLAVRAQAPAGGGAPSVGTILNPDGTVRAGTQGSFDASGYRLSYGQSGEPQLRPAGSAALGWNTVGGAVPGMPNGVNNPVYALAISGTDVYVGGAFTEAGGVAANYVAKWNGTAWSSLGTGAANGVSSIVDALAVSGPDLYVGGRFTQAGGIAANYVAKWNGTSWSSLGTGAANGVNNWVWALAVSGPDVYVGGGFRQAGGVAANLVAKWNGTTWSSLGTGTANGVTGINVNALAVSGTDVYVGGSFTQAGGIAANLVAKWNGTSWSSLGTGMANGTGNVYVGGLAVSGTDVYVGGNFTQAGGVVVNLVAKWNGTSWSSLGTGTANGVSDWVQALAVSGTDVYVGGRFTQAGGAVTNYVTKWNGMSWSSLGMGPANGVSGWVQALAVSGTDVYVGGFFSQAGGVTANHVAYYTPSVLSATPAARSLTSLTLAPNPTAGSVRLTGAPAGAQVQVFDALGRLVLSTSATTTGTALLSLPAELARGLYIVRTGSQAKRLVLE